MIVQLTHFSLFLPTLSSSLLPFFLPLSPPSNTDLTLDQLGTDWSYAAAMQHLLQSRTLPPPHVTTSPSLSTPSAQSMIALPQRKSHEQFTPALNAHTGQYQPLPSLASFSLPDAAKFQLAASGKNGQTLSIPSGHHSASPSPTHSPLHLQRHLNTSPSLQQVPSSTLQNMLAPSPSSAASSHASTPSPRTPLELSSRGTHPAPLHLKPMAGRHAGLMMETDIQTPSTPQSPYPQQGGLQSSKFYGKS